MKIFRDSYAEGIETVEDLHKALQRLIQEGYGKYDISFDGGSLDYIALFLDHDEEERDEDCILRKVKLEGYISNWN